MMASKRFAFTSLTIVLVLVAACGSAHPEAEAQEFQRSSSDNPPLTSSSASDLPLPTTEATSDTNSTSTSSSIPPTTSTTPATSTTTLPPNTTTPSTSSSTTTTTAAPITTPSTSSSTTTTTPAPTTSTRRPPAPSPPPNPPPPPSDLVWSWPVAPNDSCILVHLTAQLNITYQTKNNSISPAFLYNIPVESNATSGSCADDKQFVLIKWATGNSLKLHFDRLSDHYQLRNFSLVIDASQLPDAKPKPLTLLLYSLVPHFDVHTDQSYQCARPDVIRLSAAKHAHVLTAHLTVARVHTEAFRHRSGAQFSPAFDCDAPPAPEETHHWPIVLLVLVVLLALASGAFLYVRRIRGTGNFGYSLL